MGNLSPALPLPIFMHSELQSLVSAGKLPPAAARALEALPPGTFCQHKSWGFGRVAEWRPDDDQVLIDFGSRKAHPMKLSYVAETVQPLPPEHLLARKAQDAAGLKKLATEDPAAVVRLAVQHAPGGKLTPVQLAAMLMPEIFHSEAEFKRWWDGPAKRALKAAGGFVIPSKKTEPISLRDGGAATTAGEAAAGLLARFQSARQNKEQLQALDAIAKDLEFFKVDPAALMPVLTAVGNVALQAQRLAPARAIELLAARDEIVSAAGVTLPEGAPALASLLRGTDADLARLLDDLPAGRQRTAIAALPSAYGEESENGWVPRSLALLPHTRQPRVVGEIVGLFEKRGRAAEPAAFFERCLRDYTISCEMLLWLCREHGHDDPATASPETPFAGQLGRVFGATLSALDRDRFGDVRRGTRLRDLLLSDRSLASALLAATPASEQVGIGRALLASPAFEELDRRSLMGRLIKSHPQLAPLLGGGEEKGNVQPLVVSWSSLERRKEEYDKLVNKDIPKNSQEIGLARSYGDLRENFEFKAAKEMQTVLMRRKAELEIALARARGTNFENPDLTQVSIGTVVTLQRTDGGEPEVYTILGAWDGDPERHLISYQTAIGQALIGHRVGETLALPSDQPGATPREVTIQEIRAYKAV